jgi:hypothetical protein
MKYVLLAILIAIAIVFRLPDYRQVKNDMRLIESNIQSIFKAIP